jgi:hypothetical protein
VISNDHPSVSSQIVSLSACEYYEDLANGDAKSFLSLSRTGMSKQTTDKSGKRH